MTNEYTCKDLWLIQSLIENCMFVVIVENINTHSYYYYETLKFDKGFIETHHILDIMKMDFFKIKPE